MKKLTTTAALAALLAAAPAVAQTEQPAQEEKVYRNDLPETRHGARLPSIEAVGDGEAIAAEARQSLDTAARGSIAAMQFGNLVSMKEGSGIVRDLGDVMVLLHSQINQQLDAWAERSGTRLPEAMSEEDKTALEALGNASGEELNLGLARWVADAYPGHIDAWEQLSQLQGFEPLATAVLGQLEGQLMVAERVLEKDGQITEPSSEISKVLSWGEPAVALDERQEPGPGQTDERQHTPDPEAAEVQSGENYRHEQVETDPQTATRALPDRDDEDAVRADRPAGEMEILNSAGLFSALENPSVEIEQLESASRFDAGAVRVVAAEEILKASDLETLRGTVAERRSDLEEMRQAIEGQNVLAEAVSESPATIETVIAFDVLDEGVVIYTLDVVSSD